MLVIHLVDDLVQFFLNSWWPPVFKLMSDIFADALTLSNYSGANGGVGM